jgi:hypothetical protein
MRVLTLIYILVVILVAFRLFPFIGADVRGSWYNIFAIFLILPLFPMWKWINRKYMTGVDERRWDQDLGTDTDMSRQHEKRRRKQHRTT